jgi:hypothetical protein
MKWQLPRAFRRRRKHPLKLSRRLKVLLLDLLGREEPPERVAAAIALGIGVGFSPFIGIHFLIAIGLAFLLRLNRFDALLGQFAGNPWTLPPVFAAGYALGRKLLRFDRARVPRFLARVHGTGAAPEARVVHRGKHRRRGSHRALRVSRDPDSSPHLPPPASACRATRGAFARKGGP